MYNLNWTQAQEAMREGKRVKNRHFTDEEFFYMENGQLWDEMGYPMTGWYKGYAWQEEGWMVIGENPNLFHKVEEWHNQDYSALEDRVIATYITEGYDLKTASEFARDAQKWDDRELGASEDHVEVASEAEVAALNDALSSQGL